MLFNAQQAPTWGDVVADEIMAGQPVQPVIAVEQSGVSSDCSRSRNDSRSFLQLPWTQLRTTSWAVTSTWGSFYSLSANKVDRQQLRSSWLGSVDSAPANEALTTSLFVPTRTETLWQRYTGAIQARPAAEQWKHSGWAKASSSASTCLCLSSLLTLFHSALNRQPFQEKKSKTKLHRENRVDRTGLWWPLHFLQITQTGEMFNLLHGNRTKHRHVVEHPNPPSRRRASTEHEE